MEIKDRITIVISIIALVLSIVTFADARISRSSNDDFERSKNLYSAYRLGDRFGASVVFFTQTNQGNEEELKSFKNEILGYLKDPQAYADMLSLRVDLADIISTYSSKPSFNSEISSVVRDRIMAVHAEDVSSVYMASFWSTWLHINSLISLDKGNGDWIVKEYNEKLFPIFYKEFEKLNIETLVVKNAVNIQDVIEVSKNIRSSLKHRYVEM